MNVYTGQFAKANLYDESGLAVCSIARYDPPWFHGVSFKELAPSKELLAAYKSDLSFGKFSKEFLSYLETVDFDPILAGFDEICGEFSGVVLCCYEP